MLKFENELDLATYMYEKIFDIEEEIVSVVADKELIIRLMTELLCNKDTVLDVCEINSYDYDREYLTSLWRDEEDNLYHLSVTQTYNYEQGIYFSTDGYILFHEDVNSKAQIDMQNNPFTEISEIDWFIIGEDNSDFDCENCDRDECVRCWEDCAEHGKKVAHSKNDGNDMHGFTVSKSDRNSYYSMSFYSTDKLSKRDIQGLIQEVGF